MPRLPGVTAAHRIVVSLTALALAVALLASAATTAGAAGDNGRIAYVLQDYTTRTNVIWTMEPDGSDRRPLTQQPGVVTQYPMLDSQPAWSPDGTSVAFTRQQQGAGRQIWVASLDGSEPRRVTNGPSDTAPAFSPDGRRIAFNRPVNNRPEIATTAADSTATGTGPDTATMLTSSPAGSPPYAKLDPAWSPDGTTIAFSYRYLGFSLPGGRIMTMDASTGQVDPDPVTDTDTDSRPRWSPDGTRIAIDRAAPYNPEFTGPHSAYLMDADGQNAAPLLPAPWTGSQPSWSPDGNRVLAIDLEANAPYVDIWAFDPDGGNAVNLTNTANRLESQPAWGPVPGSVPTGPRSQTFGPDGGTLATGEEATAADPAAAAVTTPVASSITIGTPAAVAEAPSGYAFLPAQFDIEARSGDAELVTDAADPLRLAFTVDATLMSGLASVDALEVFRDGEPIAPCTAAGVAAPDPCVAGRSVDAVSGDARITVLSTHASRWNLGSSTKTPYAFRGFLAPVDAAPTLNVVKAGSGVPLKFGLGGDMGLGVVAEGYPTIRSIACDASAAVDPLETSAGGSASGLAYDAGDDLYTYVWKTPRNATGCRELTLKTDDGIAHRARFRLR